MKSALRDCSNSLRTLLERALRDDVDLSPFFDPLDPSPQAIGTFVVGLHNPEEFAGREQEGISLWLYLVERDPDTLNQPVRRTAPDRLPSRPLPLRLHYLLTPRVDHVQRTQASDLEQLILGKALQVLHDAPRLAGHLLIDGLAGSTHEFFVRLEPLPLDHITRVWDALEVPYQLCVSYEVSVVPVHAGLDPVPTVPVDSLLGEIGVARREGA
ncbi:DUF4255 domain-containing protein [Aquincola sp. MAHUQ-54]|uniref:DUF4255 domain-containing protein n=1 Tax=Aquincola agrisoli TaxID=3119538 RepID=A0AAW9Q943_9BURK